MMPGSPLQVNVSHEVVEEVEAAVAHPERFIVPDPARKRCVFAFFLFRAPVLKARCLVLVGWLCAVR